MKFTDLTRTDLQALHDKFGSPLYLMDIEGIKRRFSEFKAEAKRRYSRSEVALSYKTNFLQALLEKLHAEGAYAEVVSGVEYEIAKRFNIPGEKIIFNGPMKNDAELEGAIQDSAIINCDHMDELDRIEIIARRLGKKVKVGLRLCFPDGSDWARFGFLVTESAQSFVSADTAVERIVKSNDLFLGGIHCQLGTNIRAIEKFAELGRNLAKYAENILGKYGVRLEWINVGGGLAGISPTIAEERQEPYSIPSIHDYLSAIISPLESYLRKVEATLFFEPGRTLYEPYGALLMRVIGRRQLPDGGLGLICNAGYNHVPTCKVYNHPVHVPPSVPENPIIMTTLFGPTCNKVDSLHSPIKLPVLSPNDFLLMYGVGAYSIAWCYAFIRLRPAIVFWYGGHQAEIVRREETVEHINRLEVFSAKSRGYNFFQTSDSNNEAASAEKVNDRCLKARL